MGAGGGRGVGLENETNSQQTRRSFKATEKPTRTHTVAQKPSATANQNQSIRERGLRPESHRNPPRWTTASEQNWKKKKRKKKKTSLQPSDFQFSFESNEESKAHDQDSLVWKVHIPVISSTFFKPKVDSNSVANDTSLINLIGWPLDFPWIARRASPPPFFYK